MHAYFLQFQFCYYFPYILFLVSLIFYSSILFAKFCINCYYFFHSILYCFSNFLYTLTPIMPRFFIPRFLWLFYPVTYGCSILPFVAVLSCPLWLFYLATCNIDYFIYPHVLALIRTLYSITVFCLVTFTYFHIAIYILIHLFPSAF